ncbi:MAG: glycoside hydrolase family 65 protein [Chloroflexota bacterium]
MPADRTLESVQSAPDLGIWRTRRSHRVLAIATDVELRSGTRRLPPDASTPLTHRWHLTTSSPSRLVFARAIAVSRDGDDTVAVAARSALAKARQHSFRRIFADHTRAWAKRWGASDIVLDGDPWLQQALRFALYHLTSAANPEDERVSIGARALTGDGYLGHVFWDTDIFLLPFYIHTWPAAARALLMYRYHTLPAARAKAARLGYRGAFYPWESTDTGDEATPPLVIGPDGQIIPIRNGTDEVHISADVAYAVWRYWEATHDATFLVQAGAEIVLETARFWASRTTLEADGHYHIRGVIGPDEYHEAVDDNAYTNVMAQWNLERGVETAHLLQRRWPERWADLAPRLHLTADEVEQWQEIAGRLITGFDSVTGLYEQFAGYFGLEQINLAAYEPRTAPMDVLLGRERIQRTQVIKQADVVMLLALLEDRFPEHVRHANFAYYEPRYGHGSSLSPPLHALVAARLGYLEKAERYLRQNAAIDLDDTMGNTAHGVHIGALGGLWQAMIFGFGGITLNQGTLHLTPRLLPHWNSLRFPVQWRGRTVRVEIQPPLASVTLERGRPLGVTVAEAHHQLQPGETWVCRYAPLQPEGSRKDSS